MASASLLSKAGLGIGKKAGPVKAPRAYAGRRPSAGVVRASKDGPHELPMKMFGALAAAQMALLPISGPAMADITTDLLPETAKSQEARDELNAKTSALPSLKETAQSAGDALSGGSDVAGDVKKAVGDAKSALPDVPEVSSNPAQDFANRAKSAVKSAKSNLPVSSAVFDASLLQKDVSQELSQKASATAKQAGAKVQSGLAGVPSPQDLTAKIKSAADKAGDVNLNPARDIGSRAEKAASEAKATAPSNPAQEFANRAKSAVKSAKANLPVGNVFGGGSLQKNVSQELSQKASATAKQAGAKVQSGLAGVPSPQDLANKAKSGLSGVPSPQDLTAKIKAAADKAGDVNPAADFASRAEKTAKGAKRAVSGGFSNPAKEYANRAKEAVNKATGGDIPNPAKEFAKQAQKAKGSVQKATAGADLSNPAKEFASQAQKAKGSVQQATAGVDIPNPAKEFANQASKAKAGAKSAAKDAGINLPVAGPGLYDYSALQTDVGFFGFGKKAEQAASKVNSAAGEVQSKASEVGDKVADAADQASPKSFNIFDAGSVSEAQKTLKANLDKAASEKSDPAERVFPIGKPGETQEENAERIRIQSENANTPMGDARAPTSGA